MTQGQKKKHETKQVPSPSGHLAGSNPRATLFFKFISTSLTPSSPGFLISSLHFPVPHASMATTHLPSVSMDLLTLDFLCKWNHRIRGICAWLFLLRIRFSRFSRIVEWLITSLIFMAEQYSIAWIYRMLFILSSGHLGCLHLRLL